MANIERTSITKEQREAIGLLSIGTFLEYFDLMLYIHMAVLLNELFFPRSDPFDASLLSACAFSSTYLLRPFGALLFGYLGDMIGSRSTVIITTGLMVTSCIIMANLPPYSQIGLSAGWVVTICRIVQGMSSIGEITGAQLFLCETIKPPALYPAIAGLAFAISVGTFAALGVLSLVASSNFDWTLAFWIGAGIACIGTGARIRLRETPEFSETVKKIKNKIKHSNISPNNTNSNIINKQTSIALFIMDCMWPLCFYFVYIHCGNILKNTFYYSAEQVIQQNFVVSILQMGNCLVFVFLTYKIYPLVILKIKLFISFFLFALCPYLLNHIDNPVHLLFLQSAIIFFACDAAPATSIFYKYFPVFKRFTYIGFLYAVSRALTYIITSFSFVYLVDYFGNYGTLFIMVPICIGYFFGLRYFEKLEETR